MVRPKQLRALLTVVTLGASLSGAAFAAKGVPPPGKTQQTVTVAKQSTTAAKQPAASAGKRPSAPGHASLEGVLQSFSSRIVVLRQLDGTVVSVRINVRTLVLVDGKPGRLAAVRPGFVVVVTRNGNAPASELRFVRSG